MKYLYIFLIVTATKMAAASDVITCGDAMSVGSEAKLALHSKAQLRAQRSVEEFVEKEVRKPFVDAFGNKSDLATMSSLIEVYWCETHKTPLHSAYYRFYTSNKHVFK